MKRINFLLLIAAMMFVVGCSDNGNSIKIKDNPYLGKVPSYDYAKFFNKIMYEAESDVRGEKARNDMKKYEIRQEYKKLIKESDEKYEKLIEEAGKEIIGRELPCEVQEGTCFSLVSPVVITNVSEYGLISVECQLKLERQPNGFKENVGWAMMANDEMIDVDGFVYTFHGMFSDVKVGDVVTIRKSLPSNNNYDKKPDFTKLIFLSPEGINDAYQALKDAKMISYL